MPDLHHKGRRHSKLHALSAEHQAELNRLLIEDTTYEEIVEHFKGRGVDLSRSSVGRYGKEFMNQVRELKILEDQARALLTGEPEDAFKLEEAASKLAVKGILMWLLEGGKAAVDRPFMLKNLSDLQKASVSRERLKIEMRRKAEAAVGRIEKAATALSKEEMIKMIREEVYGLAT